MDSNRTVGDRPNFAESSEQNGTVSLRDGFVRVPKSEDSLTNAQRLATYAFKIVSIERSGRARK